MKRQDPRKDLPPQPAASPNERRLDEREELRRKLLDMIRRNETLRRKKPR